MKHVIDFIKLTISKCKEDGKMFFLPSLNRDDVKVTEKDMGSYGSVLYSKEYKMEFEDGGWIHIVYESKDKDRPFQVNPDGSVIKVTSSDSSSNFSDAWDER